MHRRRASREGVSMLSHAGHGPGGNYATPSRREPKVAVCLQWQQLRRWCRVWGPAAGCGLLAEAEAVSGRAAVAAFQATGSSRPHKKMNLALPTAACPAQVRRGALCRCPADLDGTQTAVLIACAVSPDRRAHGCGGMLIACGFLSSTWRRVEASFTTY